MKFLAPLLFAGCCALGLAGCSRAPSAEPPPPAEPPAPFPRPAAGEFAVMTFNLNQYALLDRDGDADTLEPKPPEEAGSIVEVIRQVSPDILAVQEMGDPAAWAEFKYSLRQAGLDYGHETYLRRGRSVLNLAVLSRFPIVATNCHVDDAYTIGPTKFPVMRGFIEIDLEIQPQYRLRLMVAHLKSKVFHSFGQAEMRRNEARLLNNRIRDALADERVNLLVVGDFNDTPASAALRDISSYKRRRILHDLRPADAVGDAWTHRQNDDTYHRIDYMLASPGLLPEVVPEKTYAVRSPLLAGSSDHRPLVATFVAAERHPEAAPDLSQRLPPEIHKKD